MDEGYMNVVYPEAIVQGAFALMISPKIRNLPIKVQPFPFIPGSHGSWAEQHTPLLIAAPGLPEGIRVDTPVSDLDIFPTISHLHPALELPAGAEGKSLF
jgi:hypothetical protein